MLVGEAQAFILIHAAPIDSQVSAAMCAAEGVPSLTAIETVDSEKVCFFLHMMSGTAQHVVGRIESNIEITQVFPNIVSRLYHVFHGVTVHQCNSSCHTQSYNAAVQ